MSCPIARAAAINGAGEPVVVPAPGDTPNGRRTGEALGARGVPALFAIVAGPSATEVSESDPAWAWAPYAPSAARPWNLHRAAHLCRRAGFGADWGRLQEALAAGPQASVSKFLNGGAEATTFNEVYDGYETASAETAGGLCAWWLRRMIETPHPLLERMTLFWHGYFGVSQARIGNPELMCRYLHRLRQHALGRFDLLLEMAVEDPAMLLALNARVSRKARPDANFSRALLEEFTLGAGRFSEADVRATARALTGWRVSQWEAGYNPDEHDAEPKTLLGQTGNWGRKDVLRILLKQPETARRVAAEVCRCLIAESDPPPESVMAQLAVDFAKDYNLSRLVETVLRSNLFFSAVGRKIKSPIEFALGIIQAFEGGAPTLRLASDLAALGQDLLEPPTVKGWAGGRNWIDRFTVLGRARLAQQLLAGSGAYAGKLDPEATAVKHGQGSAEASPAFLFSLLAQENVSKAAQSTLFASLPSSGSPAERLRRLAALIATLPEFNLA